MRAASIIAVLLGHASLCASHYAWRVEEHDKNSFHDWARWERKLKKVFQDELGEWGSYVSFSKMHEWVVHEIKSQVRSEAEKVEKKFRSSAKVTARLKEDLEAEKLLSSEFQAQLQQERQACDEDIASHRSKSEKLARRLERQGEEKARFAWEARTEKENAAAAETQLRAMQLGEAAARENSATPECQAPQRAPEPLEARGAGATCLSPPGYVLLVTAALASVLLLLLGVAYLYERELRWIRLRLARLSLEAMAMGAADQTPSGPFAGPSAAAARQVPEFLASVSDKTTDFDVTRTIEVQCPNVSRSDITLCLKLDTCVVTIRREAHVSQQQFELASPAGVFDFVDERASFADGLLTLVFQIRMFKERVFRFPEHFCLTPGDSDDEQQVAAIVVYGRAPEPTPVSLPSPSQANVTEDELTAFAERESSTACAPPAQRESGEIVLEAKPAVPTDLELSSAFTPPVQAESEDRIADSDSACSTESSEMIVEAKPALPSDHEIGFACNLPPLAANEAHATEQRQVPSTELEMLLSYTSPSRATSEAPSEEFEMLHCANVQCATPSAVSEDEPESPPSGCSECDGFELVEARDATPPEAVA